MELLDNNRFQITNQNQRALLGDNVATNIEAVPYGEAQVKHHLSTYSDKEKKWLVEAAGEERSKGKGFMNRVKERCDLKYPDKKHVSKQNLSDSSVKFGEEIENITATGNKILNVPEQEEKRQRNAARKWTNEMKINLLKIYERERKNGRGYMKRMEEEWNTTYSDKPTSAQILRDNAATGQLA